MCSGEFRHRLSRGVHDRVTTRAGWHCMAGTVGFLRRSGQEHSPKLQSY